MPSARPSTSSGVSSSRTGRREPTRRWGLRGLCALGLLAGLGLLLGPAPGALGQEAPAAGASQDAPKTAPKDAPAAAPAGAPQEAGESAGRGPGRGPRGGPGGNGGWRNRGPRGPETALGTQMEQLKTNLKALSVALGAEAPDVDAALVALAGMQSALVGAKAEKPLTLADQPEAERAAYLLEFRKDMAKTLGITAEIEVALCEGRVNDAVELVKGPLMDARETGHDRFQKEDH